MKKKDFSRHPLRVFFSYFRPHRRLFAIDMGCSLLAAIIDLVFPFVSRRSMTQLLPQGLFRVFFVIMAVLVAAYVLKGLLYYVITVVGHRMGVLVEADMRQDVFDHMQTLSFSFFDHNRTGVLMSRVTTDLFEITELAHHGPENVLISVVTIAGALAVLYGIQWKLALVLTLVLPLCFWFTMRQRVRMRDTNIEVKRKTAEINAAIESSISGVRTAKAFANETQEEQKFAATNDKYKVARVDYIKAMGLFQSGMEFTTGVLPVIVIAVGGLLIMRGEMDYVDLVTFTLYVATFISPIRRLAQFTEQWMQGSAGFTRFLEIMRTEPEIRDEPGAQELENVRGDVDYDRVSFHYDDGTEVLHDVTLHIPAGETFALVGPSGGGKTTLCSLLPRFYDVSSGAVRVDGHDVRSLTQESLRRAIGIIQQDVFMFAGSIRENIRYGRPDAVWTRRRARSTP